MSWLLALLVPQPFLGVFCSKTNLVVQERGGLALWIGGLARAFLSIVYVSAHDLESEPPMKVRLPCCFQKHEKCLRVQSLEKTASLLWLDSLMNQVITPRFPLQGPLNCYLIKRWYQAVTHKAGSIITMELEKYLFPDVIPPGKGHSVPAFGDHHVPSNSSSWHRLLWVSDGSLHWSAANQVRLFLWLTLISFCWQQAVAWGPAAFWRLPTHARATGAGRADWAHTMSQARF